MKVTLMNVERAQRRLRVMEDDLEIMAELVRRYGTVQNLVKEVNESRWLLGMPSYGEEAAE